MSRTAESRRRGGAPSPSRTARFLFGAARAEQIPRLTEPIVAFVGRSNVGKSSLLNRLVGQRKLARVSKRPGRTQEVNFFLVDDRIVIADLPGYGFARVPLLVRAQWKVLVESFLRGSNDIRLVAVLVDARRGLQAEDLQMLDYLRAVRRSGVLIATKVDKLTRAERRMFEARFAADVPGITTIITSAITGEGIDEIWPTIEAVCA